VESRTPLLARLFRLGRHARGRRCSAAHSRPARSSAGSRDRGFDRAVRQLGDHLRRHDLALESIHDQVDVLDDSKTCRKKSINFPFPPFCTPRVVPTLMAGKFYRAPRTAIPPPSSPGDFFLATRHTSLPAPGARATLDARARIEPSRRPRSPCPKPSGIAFVCRRSSRRRQPRARFT